MKKFFTIFALALVALVACNKEPKVEDKLVINGETTALIPIEGLDEPYVVTFSSTKAWTAKLDVTDDVAIVAPKSGEAGEECKVKVTFTPNDEFEDRTIVLTLAAEGITPATFTFVQTSKPHFYTDQSYFEPSAKGETINFKVISNVEYTTKCYEDTFTWMHVTNDGDNFTVTIDPNNGYDPRESYIKFTTSALQVPVLDENGEETGETEDLVVRVYFEQEGSLVTSWRQDFTWDLYNESHRYSTALAGDYLAVSTGLGVRLYSKADGSFVQDISSALPFAPTGITNDDAGNIVISVGGDFPLTDTWELDADAQQPLQVFYLPNGSMDAADAKLLFTYYDGFYGYGLDNIRATGDVTKDACITMCSAAGSPGGSYAVAWEIKDGVATTADTYTDYVTLSWTSEIWASYNLVAKHIGTTVDSGILCIGYDGNYNLHYNAGMSSANWQEVLVTGSSWAEGYNALDIIDWNGHKYAGFIGMSYFAFADWDYDGTVDDYMPSYLWLVNIDDPANPVVVSTSEYYADPSNFCYGSTTDLCLEVEGNDLAAYVFDSSASCYLKVVYPAL